MKALVLLVLLLSQFQPSYAGYIAWAVVENSAVYEVLKVYEREFKYWASETLLWEVADYKETILTYYNLLYDAILHNELEDAAKYCGVLAVLLLKAKGYNEASGESLMLVVQILDWDKVKLLDLLPEEIIDEWLLYEADTPEDFLYAYASVLLSLLDKMPVNAFVRVMHTPLIREMYVVSLALIIAASTFFVYKRAKREVVKPEIEAPP